MGRRGRGGMAWRQEQEVGSSHVTLIQEAENKEVG